MVIDMKLIGSFACFVLFCGIFFLGFKHTDRTGNSKSKGSGSTNNTSSTSTTTDTKN